MNQQKNKMKYLEAFKKLEKKNKEKAYYLDLCRRGNIQIFETPVWFLTFIGLFGLITHWMISLTCGLTIFMMFILMILVNKSYKNKILEELK